MKDSGVYRALMNAYPFERPRAETECGSIIRALMADAPLPDTGDKYYRIARRHVDAADIPEALRRKFIERLRFTTTH